MKSLQLISLLAPKRLVVPHILGIGNFFRTGLEEDRSGPNPFQIATIALHLTAIYPKQHCN